MTGDQTQQLIDAVSSPVRREILWLVWDRELTAGEIAAAFPLRPPTISSHLGVLRRAGLVTMTRNGTFRRYRAQIEVAERLRHILGTDGKWRSSGRSGPGLPSSTWFAVVVSTTVACEPDAAFRAFVDSDVYSRWVGAPVSIVEGRFAMTTGWGVRVRGRYEHLLPPRLIVMRWDFGRGELPIPGDGQRAYLEIAPEGTGCRVEVTQLARSADESAFMERAWGMVLARLTANAPDVLGS